VRSTGLVWNLGWNEKKCGKNRESPFLHSIWVLREEAMPKGPDELRSPVEMNTLSRMEHQEIAVFLGF
jgi:hypothetical protein